ncbi:MAG: hypothetical protein MZW92_71680 [Comamonadaceae bacterium]|nr:hypothetical protein [Comamonadaceae bacterium]
MHQLHDSLQAQSSSRWPIAGAFGLGAMRGRPRAPAPRRPASAAPPLPAGAARRAAPRADGATCPTSPTWSRSTAPAVVSVSVRAGRAADRARGSARRAGMPTELHPFFRGLPHAGRCPSGADAAAAARARASSSAPTA